MLVAGPAFDLSVGQCSDSRYENLVQAGLLPFEAPHSEIGGDEACQKFVGVLAVR